MAEVNRQSANEEIHQSLKDRNNIKRESISTKKDIEKQVDIKEIGKHEAAGLSNICFLHTISVQCEEVQAC